jgi:hypothetical protein
VTCPLDVPPTRVSISALEDTHDVPMQHGHQTIFVAGHVPSAVDQMILEKVEGMLILSHSEMSDEIASRFARATADQLAQPN